MSSDTCATSTHPRTVLIGHHAAGKHTIASRLLGLGGDRAADRSILALDNKYYTASTQLVICDDADGGAADLVRGAHAVLVVIDGSHHRSFAAAKACIESCDTDAADVRLLICNKADLCHLKPAWHEEVRSWCIDHLFEFVQAAAGNEDVDAALAHHPEEQQGTARVRAALEATMWPDMVLKSDSNPSDTAATVPAQAVGNAATEGIKSDANGSTACTTSKAAAGADDPQSEDSEAASDEPNPFLPSSGKAEWDGDDTADNPEDDQLQANVAEFEALMKQMRRARDKAAQLPDEERRAHAAAMAERFADMLGLQEGDDTGSDDQHH